MNLVQFIEQVGMDNIVVQRLEQDIIGATLRKKLGGTELRFIQNQITCDDLLDPEGRTDRRVGLILWVPKRLLPTSLQSDENRSDTR